MASTVKKLERDIEGATTAELAEQVEILRADIASLAQTLAGVGKAKGDDALNTAKSKAADVRDATADAAETARLQMMELQDQANGFVKKQPATALGIAAGLGFLVGFLGSRR